MFMFIPLPRASTLSVVSIFTQKWARWSKSCQSHWHSWSTNWAFPWLLKKPKTCPFFSFSFSVRASLGMENQRCHCCKNHPEGSQHKGSQTWLGPHSKFLLIDSLHFTALIFKWLIFRAYLTSQNRFFCVSKKRLSLLDSIFSKFGVFTGSIFLTFLQSMLWWLIFSLLAFLSKNCVFFFQFLRNLKEPSRFDVRLCSALSPSDTAL